MRSKGRHIVFGFVFYLSTALSSEGQVLIAVHDFETTLGTPALAISTGTPAYASGSSASTDRPATSPFYTSSTRAWTESNATKTITFANQSLSGYTNCYIEYRLASFSINSTGNGADAGDIVTTSISVDGGTTFYSTARVLGNSNAYWSYSASGNATTTFDGDVTPVDFQPAGGGSRTTDGYSTVHIDIPNGNTQVMIRIILLNNSTNEKWSVDDVSVYGTSTCTPPATPPTPAAAANPSCTATTLDPLTPLSGETWYWQGTNPTGTNTTDPTSSVYPVSVSGTYYVRAMTNSTLCWSASSASIVVTINSSPAISVQPSNTSVAPGGNIVFSVTASGDGLTYQWQEDQGSGFANISDGGIYSGATTATLSLTGVLATMDTWQYQCIVSGTCSPAITSATAVLSVSSAINYRTRASGNWGVNTTWETWDGSAWVTCASGDFPDAALANVEIRNTHTVDLDGSGAPPFDCKDLTVQTGGLLWTNHFGTTNQYIQIYGNIVCNGTIGVSTGDDICFDITGGISCTISGTGSFYATRIRKDGSINASSNSSLIIDMNIFLFWSTGSGTILYNDGSTSLFDVTVNAGKTLKGVTAGAVTNNISMDGLGGADGSASGGSYTIHGTIEVDGTAYAMTNNSSASRPVSIIIKNGGTLKCAYFTCSASGAGTSTLTIENGGRLNLTGADASSNAFSSFSATNNIYNLNSGSTVEYSGAVAQNVESLLSYSNITFSGGGAKTLNGATNVSGIATFTNGLVTSTATNLLNMSSTSSATGANNSSFVKGPVSKTGTTDFIFPVGKDLQYRSIAVSTLSGSETFTAEYFHADPDAVPYDVTLKDATLDDIGRCEYWILNRAGAVNASVSLSWNTYSCGVTSLPDLAVARWDGTTWKDEGNTATTGAPDPSTGTVTSGVINSFSPFTLASRAIGVNPLPIELLSFTANYNNEQVELKWSTASETNNDYFTIERSIDAVEFHEINVIDGAGNSINVLNYNTTDVSPLNGISYYRLKQTDFDGQFKYSSTLTVQKDENDFEILSAQYSEGQLSVYFNCDSDCRIRIELYDLTGRKVYSKLEMASSNSVVEIPVKGLKAGIYLLRASDGKRSVSKKVKM